MSDAPKDALPRLEAGQQALLQHALSTQQQLDAMMALLKRLVELLTPSDLDDGRPRLEELLARLIAQQGVLIDLSKQTLAGVARIEARLDAPTAMARRR